MILKSPGHLSNLIFTNFDGLAVDRGSYLAVHTPTNPNYFWGNLLIFDRPPQKGDYETWCELFKKEFTNPIIYHMTFAWDSPTTGDVSEFIEKDFRMEENVVLAATSVHKPAKFNHELEVRVLKTDGEWNAMVEAQTAGSTPGRLSKDEWQSFYTKQAKRYQAMQKANWGDWFGGFIGGKLVAGLGIFRENGLARYQLVSVHPDYRRRGLCGTLVYHSAAHAFASYGVSKLVMVADPGYFAIDIYESVGFTREVTEYGVCWWDKDRA